jgi:hypothetical protein
MPASLCWPFRHGLELWGDFHWLTPSWKVPMSGPTLLFYDGMCQKNPHRLPPLKVAVPVFQAAREPSKVMVFPCAFLQLGMALLQAAAHGVEVRRQFAEFGALPVVDGGGP